jgi:hypothetical protein
VCRDSSATPPAARPAALAGLSFARFASSV